MREASSKRHNCLEWHALFHATNAVFAQRRGFTAYCLYHDSLFPAHDLIWHLNHGYIRHDCIRFSFYGSGFLFWGLSQPCGLTSHGFLGLQWTVKELCSPCLLSYHDYYYNYYTLMEFLPLWKKGSLIMLACLRFLTESSTATSLFSFSHILFTFGFAEFHARAFGGSNGTG